MAVGDSSGTLHILEVPWSLSHASTNEVYIIPCMYVVSVVKVHVSGCQGVVVSKDMAEIILAFAENVIDP